MISTPSQQALAGVRRYNRRDFEVAGRIGKGSNGGVWQAKVLSTVEQVVLKVVFPDVDLDPEDAAKASPTTSQLSSFKREIKILSVIDRHPNIAGLLGITSDFRVLVLDEAMTDLHHLVKAQQSRGHRLPLKIVRQWSHEILTGLAHLHSLHIMHRDLASTNVLIYKGDTVKICDFGLATEAHPSEMCKVHREIVTLWYRAPELLMGAEEYSSKIDVWSVGVVMLEMLLGRCPTVGRVQDVCTCPFATHFNYNGDQLMKIFGLLGSPTDKDRDFLQSMHCLDHFKDFPKHSSQLSQVVTTALLESLRDQISPQQLCRRTSSYLTDTPASKAQPCFPKARLLSVRSSILPRLKSSPIVSESLGSLGSLGMTSLPRLKSASSPIMSESLGIPKIGLNNPHKHAGMDA